MTIQEKCPDCGTQAGNLHEDQCDVQRCSVCGQQWITCRCDGHDPIKSVWTGDFPKKKDVAESVKLSKDKRIGVEPSQCFFNSFSTIEYCKEHRHATYVEGMVVDAGGMMLEHGWVETDTTILDPTLPKDDLVYFPGLRFEGRVGIAKALWSIPKPDGCEDFPIFYRFGWGGRDSPEFMFARQAVRRLSDRMASCNQPG